MPHALTNPRLTVPALAIALTSSAAIGAPVFIDFGTANGTAANATGIALADVTGQSTSRTDIKDSAGNPTSIDVTVTAVSGHGNNGPKLDGTGTSVGTLSGDALAYGFGDAASDSLFGRTRNGTVVPTITVTLSDLDPDRVYHFVGFAARNAIAAPVDARWGSYTFTGANSGTAYLNASNNDSEVFIVNGITPDANNRIVLTIGPSSEPGFVNNNSDGLYYINALRITPVPEPASAALLVLGTLACLGRRGR